METDRDGNDAVSVRFCFPAVVLPLLAVVLPLLAVVPYPDGPPLAHTGGFGEPTCMACHGGESVNAPGGALHLVGAPDRYAPGETYQLAVVLRRAGMSRAGFEAAIRLSSGEQAGRLAAPDTVRIRLQRDPAHAVWYAHHTRAGNSVAGDSSNWLLRWTAPMGHEDAIVNVAAVAGNDDNSPLGDAVYVITAVIRAR